MADEEKATVFMGDQSGIVTVDIKYEAPSGASNLQAVVEAGGYTFSVGAEWGDKVQFDLSEVAKALRARETEPSPDGTTLARGEIEVGGITKYFTYLKNGETHTGGSGSATNVTFYPADATEDDVMGNNDTRRVGWSLKPTAKDNMETVRVGHSMIGNGSKASAAEGIQTFNGRKVYGVNEPLRHTFACLNHYGYIETASALMREGKSYKITSESRFGSALPEARLVYSDFTKKNGARAVWKMSTGYVTREWAEWWAEEFLSAQKHWMYVEDAKKWLPVSIVPGSDTVTVYDESKGEMVSVEFTVMSGIRN